MSQTSDCGLLIKLISDNIARLANNELRTNDLTLSQLRYLEFLASRGGGMLPFKTMEAEFKVSQPTVAGIIRRLELKKLVVTKASPTNAKAKMVGLTAKGRQISENAELHKHKTEALLLAPLQAEEKIVLQGLLFKIYHNLQEA